MTNTSKVYKKVFTNERQMNAYFNKVTENPNIAYAQCGTFEEGYTVMWVYKRTK